MIRLLLMVIFTSTWSAASASAETEELTRSERLTLPAGGIESIRFRNLAATTLSYTGVKGTDRFDLDWTLRVKSGDRTEFENFTGRVAVTVDTLNGLATVTLEHPGVSNKGRLIRSLFRGDPEWRVELKVTGPADVDLDADAEFSELSVANTAGLLTTTARFTKVAIRDHRGRVESNVSYGEYRCSGLAGSFSLDARFADAKVEVTDLAADSGASVSFGEIDITIPSGTDVNIYGEKSFGSINYRLKGVEKHPGRDDANRTIGRGGPILSLDASFGDITVIETERYSASGRTEAAPARMTADTVLPTPSHAWWRYSADGDTLAVRVAGRFGWKGETTAVLSASESPGRPFDTIEVLERQDGLYLVRIGSDFFGRIIPPLEFDDPQLWLPYTDQAGATVNDVVGAARITGRGRMLVSAGTFEDVITYRYTPSGGSHSRTISLAPGTGFLAFDEWKLADFSLERKVAAEPSRRFTEGTIAAINIIGERFMDENDIRRLLGIEPGRTYTAADLDDAVRNLRQNPSIDDVSWDVSERGVLTLIVVEHDLIDVDFDVNTSFNRVGGVGIGPELFFKMRMGPISTLAGGGEYHFANREWTYHALAEKTFGGPDLGFTIGASYRYGYISVMDWAIPDTDASLNELLLGQTTRNYHRVDAATAYLLLGNASNVLRAEYFNDDYGSLKKHTNWSLFNSGSAKDDNPPLPDEDIGTATGFRYSVEHAYHADRLNSTVMLSYEHTMDQWSDSIPTYRRLFGNAVTAYEVNTRQFVKVRIAGGWAPNDLPGQKSFRLGGLNTLRGFEYESVGGVPGLEQGGNRMALLNIEHYIGLTDTWGLILFGDAGGVWFEGEEAKIGGIRRDLGLSLAMNADFLSLGRAIPSLRAITQDDREGLRVNWAVPVGNVTHGSEWTVNFVQGF